ncbi:MAG: alpha-amylase family glycosyl hydrolase [candidate division KSB1 bacterium]|nr:alpha-amylase family glycosyl hydrolase [candidate division KSB1 bacterium]
MKRAKRSIGFLFALAFFAQQVKAQGIVNVTFRHYPTSARVVRAFVPGTFNNWGPNSNGRIYPNAPSQMEYVDSLGFYVKRIALTVGTTQQYKFHEHYDPSGAQWQWFTDPLNRRINYADNNNSVLPVQPAMVFELWPPEGAVLSGQAPTIVAAICVSEGDSLLAHQSTVTVDGRVWSDFTGKMVEGLSLLRCSLPSLGSGVHTVLVTVRTRDGSVARDSTSFTYIAGAVYFETPSTDSCWAAARTIRWRTAPGVAARSVTLYQIGSHPLVFQPSASGEYQWTVNLRFGENRFVAAVTDTAGLTANSDTLHLRYPVPQVPQPEIVFTQVGRKVRVAGRGNDPQGTPVSYLWSCQDTNPAALVGVEGRTDSTFELDIPPIPGDYSLKLTATDPDGYANSTVNFFTVLNDSQVVIPALSTVPSWVTHGRVYCIFVRSFTPQGTLRAAADNLDHVRRMGFNVIWVLPVMDVEGTLDQGTNIGYNIVDFYRIEPVYGTEDDFRYFVRRAHELGIRVILDVTPNHTSRSHPFALDVRTKKRFSRYYDFYQHTIIPHDDNGLGQSVSADGIVYYSGFSDALLNWNWADEEARRYMLEVYTYWLRTYDIDGFRLDVYWGPHRRYGRSAFDEPLRRALRAAKADIMILGETNGTGSGSEVQYADLGGGMDVGYDWILSGAVDRFPAIATLDARLYNGGYRPGPNSLFLRFLENQDEDRVAYRYNSIEKTVPVATAIFLATGLPLLYQGQEVGMGYGMSGSRDYRVRSTVNWQNPSGQVLARHYQKLAHIRAQFPAFSRQFEDTNGDFRIDGADRSVQVRLSTTAPEVYAFGRPWKDQNGVVIMNFSGTPISCAVAVQPASWAEFSQEFSLSASYFLNDLYYGGSALMPGALLDTLQVSLSPYGVAVFTISTFEQRLQLPELTVAVPRLTVEQDLRRAELAQNYPNPFNGATVLHYRLPVDGTVRVDVLDVCGRKVKTLVDCLQQAGEQEVCWDGAGEGGAQAPSGIYFVRLIAAGEVHVRKVLRVR